MLCQVHCLDTFGFLFRSSGLKAGGGEKKTGENRSGGRCAISLSIRSDLLIQFAGVSKYHGDKEPYRELRF